MLQMEQTPLNREYFSVAAYALQLNLTEGCASCSCVLTSLPLTEAQEEEVLQVMLNVEWSADTLPAAAAGRRQGPSSALCIICRAVPSCTAGFRQACTGSLATGSALRCTHAWQNLPGWICGRCGQPPVQTAASQGRVNPILPPAAWESPAAQQPVLGCHCLHLPELGSSVCQAQPATPDPCMAAHAAAASLLALLASSI